MNMKKTNAIIVAVILAVVTFINTGCGPIDRSQFNQTAFPTNHWKVVGQGTNGQVVVETKSTNLLEKLRVHVADAVIPMTNGQSARVEITIRRNNSRGGIELISSKAYPSVD